MTSLPTAPVVATGLVGGYAAARFSGRRELGGAVLVLVGAWCGRSWWRGAGPARAVALLVTYVAAFGVSHPLAKKLGAWPSVATAATVAAGAAYTVADRAGHADSAQA